MTFYIIKWNDNWIKIMNKSIMQVKQLDGCLYIWLWFAPYLRLATQSTRNWPESQGSHIGLNAFYLKTKNNNNNNLNNNIARKIHQKTKMCQMPSTYWFSLSNPLECYLMEFYFRKESLFQGCIDNKKKRKNGSHILNNSNHIPSKDSCFSILNVCISVF